MKRSTQQTRSHLHSLFIDCIPSPTHLFSGIAPGNIASEEHQNLPSKPKKAALESIEKMRLVIKSGASQIAVPPIPRPDFSFLRNLGLLKKHGCSLKNVPRIPTTQKYIRQAVSSSAMWTANWAHTTPSCDSLDKKLHISIANLAANSHRMLETPYIREILTHIFTGARDTVIHPALPPSVDFHDEGAANDIRLSGSNQTDGLSIFVYGRNSPLHPTKKYPARQSLDASLSIAHRHAIPPSHSYFLQQNPEAIDMGVFHNDVIAMGEERFFICHENAFCQQAHHLDSISKAFENITGEELNIIQIPSSLLTVTESVSSYFFNSQIIRHPIHNEYTLLLPGQCLKKEFKHKIDRVISLVQKSAPCIQHIHYVNLSESMNNGGGPACLRLKVLLTLEQLIDIEEHTLDEYTLDELEKTVEALYPETLTLEQIVSDPTFLLSLIKSEEAISILLGMAKPWRKAASLAGLSSFLSSTHIEISHIND